MKQIKAYGIVLFKRSFNKTSILLCKSVDSKYKWGFLKGGTNPRDLTAKQTAQREFREESGILLDQKNFEKYFYQNNKKKFIGLYLVDGSNMPFLNNYLDYEGKLYKNYLSHENSVVQFFDIDRLPKIKKNQAVVIEDILEYLRKKRF